MRRLQRQTMRGCRFGIGLLVTAIPTLAHACPVCVGSSAEDYGYFWGVLFLMSMPFAVGGLIGGWLWYSYRRAWAGVAATTSTPPVERRSPQPAATTSASARRDDGDHVTPAQTCGATTGDGLPQGKERTP